MAGTNFKSVHGRQLGITSTGGVASWINSTGGGSTAPNYAQMWGPTQFETIGGTSDVIMNNAGVTFISTASTNGTNFFVGAPQTGLSKEIFIVSSATNITLQTTSTAIWFASTAATGVGVGTTTLSLAIAGGAAGSLVLRGLSATLWGIVSNTVGASS